MSLSQNIKEKAIDLGFDLVGITDASPIDKQQCEFFHQWLEAGFAGQMGYMGRNLDKRIDPARLLEGAESVIVVGLNYKPPEYAQMRIKTTATGRIAAYAQYEGYHPVMKNLMRQLADFVKSHAKGTVKFKLCVDSAPVAERALAARAGLGFIGKNHMLINPDFGPQVFLGEIITDLELERDKPTTGDCKGCDRCIKACPTGALRDDGYLDANRCISCLTIEHKGDITPELAERIGDRLFGCDECVLVCPYQKRGPAYAKALMRFYPERACVDLQRILDMNEDSFAAEFSDSTIKRTGLETLKRNAAICLENIERGKV